MLSVLYCGDYAGVDEAWLPLGREVKARELPPTGAPRILGIVAPYTGREIDPQRYCSRPSAAGGRMNKYKIPFLLTL